MHRSNHLVSGVVTGVAIALVVAACATDAQSGGTAANGSETIGFASPTNGAQLTIPFDVQLESSVALGAPETGNHHAHLYFDASTDSADYDIVYGTSWQVDRQLTPGEHTITVALANPDHSLAGATQTISVTVGAATSGESQSPPDASPALPGY